MITLRNSAIRFNTMTATENIPGALARYGRRGSLAPTAVLGSIRPEEQQHASVMGGTWFPNPGSVELSSRSAGISFDGREWILSLWLILLAYLPLWLGISWWQARRRRRRIEAMGPQAGDLGERHREPRMGTD